MNIGAGNIVYQDLPRVNMSIRDGSFERNQAFARAFEHVKQNSSALHIMGLAGNGGVHANLEHMLKLVEMAAKQNIPQVYLHLFTDGRDSPPYNSPDVIRRVQEKCQQVGVGEIVSVMGRFYAMDRDLRWERIEKAYDCLTSGLGERGQDPIAVVKAQHEKGSTDEFIVPTNIVNAQGQVVTINDNDAVIFTNYRIDRPRELTRAFTKADFSSSQAQVLDFDSSKDRKSVV